MPDDNCNICKRITSFKTKNIEEREKLLWMLNYCIPEIEWTINDHICNSCCTNLRASYKFRIFSIESNPSRMLPRRSARNSTKRTHTCSAYYYSSKLKNQCKHCKKKYLHESHLEPFINSEHSDASMSYFCKRCNKCFENQLLLKTHVVSHHRRRKSNDNKSNKSKTKTKRKLSDSITKSLEDDDAIVSKRIRRENEVEVFDGAVNKVQRKTTKQEGSLTREKKKLHDSILDNLTTQCDDYAKATVKAFYLSKANAYNMNAKTYTCALCGKTSIFTQNLAKHYKMLECKRLPKVI